jgi:hypothetical protein
MVSNDGFEELDISFRNKIMGRPNRRFPYLDKFVKFVGSNVIDVFCSSHWWLASLQIKTRYVGTLFT